MEREIHYIEPTKTPLGKEPFAKKRVAAYFRVAVRAMSNTEVWKRKQLIIQILLMKMLIG